MTININQQSFVYDKNFNTFHMTTIKCCGNMKDTSERNKFCENNSIDYQKIVFAQQVHGTVVQKVSLQDCGKIIELCDGLITNDKNVFLCIFTADCMPIFLASRDYSVVSLIHAGWRGLACGIIESALIRFRDDFGIIAQDIFAYIGPHISQCCYEVGNEVKEAFNLSLQTKYLSLSQQATKQMNDFGIKRIYINSHCTCHETEMFYSYRRQPTTNRMMSIISI